MYGEPMYVKRNFHTYYFCWIEGTASTFIIILCKSVLLNFYVTILQLNIVQLHLSYVDRVYWHRYALRDVSTWSTYVCEFITFGEFTIKLHVLNFNFKRYLAENNIVVKIMSCLSFLFVSSCGFDDFHTVYELSIEYLIVRTKSKSK